MSSPPHLSEWRTGFQHRVSAVWAAYSEDPHLPPACYPKHIITQSWLASLPFLVKFGFLV